jgi:hypothetical protein
MPIQQTFCSSTEFGDLEKRVMEVARDALLIEL